MTPYNGPPKVGECLGEHINGLGGGDEGRLLGLLLVVGGRLVPPAVFLVVPPAAPGLRPVGARGVLLLLGDGEQGPRGAT